VVYTRLYYVLACAALAIHALFIVWIVFGAVLTARRPLLRWLHIGSLVWGVLIEIVPWPCPLTVAEQWLENRARLASYRGSFLLHYLDKFVYPDVPPDLLTYAAVVVAIANFGIYARRFWRAREGKAKQG
jgi:hypothetical protein